jgi:hypothetical protein
VTIERHVDLAANEGITARQFEVDSGDLVEAVGCSVQPAPAVTCASDRLAVNSTAAIEQDCGL